MARLPTVLARRPRAEGSVVKIALVCPYGWDRHGGVQTHVRDLSRALARRAHDVRVLAPVAVRAHRMDASVEVVGRAIAIPANGSVAPIAPGPDAWWSTRRRLRDVRPDVIHIHEPLILSSSLFAITTKLAPCVGTFHASADKSALYRLFAPFLRPLADRLTLRTAVSEPALAFVSRYFPGTYEMTPNGVDAQRFRSAPPFELGAGKKVLFAGRLEERKGLETLIRAMARLGRSDATLIVAGSGPREPEARALVARTGIRARFLGALSDETFAGLFRSVDVYCHPATGKESFGIVLLEAMAGGAPVVCSELPGFRTAAGDAAVYVPPGDDRALAVALGRMLDDPEQAALMRDLGATRASAFDWDSLVDDVIELYERARDMGT
ncbi:MAG: glycosyltransferase [Actinobacteria bacterium]|nr:glycosyltransferase [Actinomycetota bacterium]